MFWPLKTRISVESRATDKQIIFTGRPFYFLHCLLFCWKSGRMHAVTSWEQSFVFLLRSCPSRFDFFFWVCIFFTMLFFQAFCFAFPLTTAKDRVSIITFEVTVPGIKAINNKHLNKVTIIPSWLSFNYSPLLGFNCFSTW